MTENRTLHRLRAFLLTLATLMFAGTIVELLLLQHYKSPPQLIPFALCGLGLLALAVFSLRPNFYTALILRCVMVIVAGGSLLGVIEHFEGNYEFAREIHPEASTLALLTPTLTGRDPLLASGVLAAAAAAAIAATYATSQRDRAATRVVPVPAQQDISRPGAAGQESEETYGEEVARHPIAGKPGPSTALD